MKYDEIFQQYKKCRICLKPKLRTELIGSRCPDCIPVEKECTKCKILKPLSDYVKRNTASDGRSSECKICYNRRIKSKKDEKRTTIRVKNAQKRGSVEWEVFQFFGQHQLKLSEKELRLICQKLKQSDAPLTTLDEILARYKVGIKDYIVEFENQGKAILQFEIDDKECLNPIGRYESLAEASIAIKGDKTGIGSISAVCRGAGYTGLGYRWRFENNEE